MAQAGATLTTSESVIFEILGHAKNPHFKQILPLLKENQDLSELAWFFYTCIFTFYAFISF